MVFVLIFG